MGFFQSKIVQDEMKEIAELQEQIYYACLSVCSLWVKMKRLDTLSYSKSC